MVIDEKFGNSPVPKICFFFEVLMELCYLLFIDHQQNLWWTHQSLQSKHPVELCQPCKSYNHRCSCSEGFPVLLLMLLQTFSDLLLGVMDMDSNFLWVDFDLQFCIKVIVRQNFSSFNANSSFPATNYVKKFTLDFSFYLKGNFPKNILVELKFL